MKSISAQSYAGAFLFLSLTSAFLAPVRAGASEPEQDSLRVSRGLRAYSDSQWAQIAGAKSTERYEIVNRDTLWDISERLFGDAKVWPKIWEINNTAILNPHMIEPRMNLMFNAGTGISLPSIALKDSGTSTIKNHYVISKDDRPGPLWDERTPRPNREWQQLGRQSWENVQVNLPPNVDRNGFDTRNRIYLRKPATGIELPHTIACDPILPLGVIEGSRNIANYAFLGSEVTIRATQGSLEVNQTYTILDSEAMTVESVDRKALSYAVSGKVKIIGVQSGTYIGEILATKNPIPRGSILVPEIKRIERTAPIPAAHKLIGRLYADKRTGSFMTGQNKWVYIDRGSSDGVQPGMIFRIFQNQDPKTLKALTNGDVFVQGDVQILQNCGKFSVGMFVWSRGDLPERYEGALLTDVSDETIRFYFNGEVSAPLETQGSQLPPPVEQPVEEANLSPANALPPIEDRSATEGDGDDWLDKLDNNQELKTEEERELQQLEKFDEAKAKGAGTPPPVAAPPSVDQAAAESIPPPPEEELPPPPPEG